MLLMSTYNICFFLVFFVKKYEKNLPDSPTYQELQYNLDGSNTDGSFTVDDSNSFLSP